MESCNDTYERWLQIQNLVEELEDACDQHERIWHQNFFTALDNLSQPELFLKNLVRGRKEFDLLLACKRERDTVVNTEWADAVNNLRECIEEHGHQEAL